MGPRYRDPALARHRCAQPWHPFGVECERCVDPEVPAPAAEEKAAQMLDALDGADEVVEQHHVGVRIHQDAVAAVTLRLSEEIAHQRRAAFVARDQRQVLQRQLAHGVGGARFVAEDEHVTGRLQSRPAAERVALDHPDVPLEGLRYAEQGEHR